MERSSDSIALEYALTEQEYVDGFRPWLAHDSAPRIRKLLVCTLVLAILGSLWLAFDPLVSVVLFTLCGVIFAGAATIRHASFVQLGKQWSSSQSIQKVISVPIGSESIEISKSTELTIVQWNAVERASLVRHNYVLMTKELIPILILPTRAIKTDDDDGRVRALLHRHVSVVNLRETTS